MIDNNMINNIGIPDVDNDHTEPKTSQVKSKMSKSMHDGVEVWCDCCSCEAEPYWVEAMEGYDLHNTNKNKQ